MIPIKSGISIEEDGNVGILATPFQTSAIGDLFSLTEKFNLHSHSEIELYTKYSVGRLNLFAFALKHGDLLLVSGNSARLDTNKILDQSKWHLRQIPWFEDTSRKITALSFDEEGLLYIGTEDGTLYELEVSSILNSVGELELDLKQTFHLDDCKIIDILIWFRDNTKMVMCNAGNGKFIFIPTNVLPVLVTFNSPITTMHLFISNAGLSCLLVCLQSNQNVSTVLDDLDVPPQEEFVVKKSIFRRAKENIISRFGDADKGLLFGRRTSRDLSTGQEIPVQSAENVNSIATTNSSSTNISLSSKSSSTVNIKFTTLEELSSRGSMNKIGGRNQFFRHVGTKLDLFEADFRQIASMTLPENISKLFVIQKIFYGVDEENFCIRLSVVHNQMLKEFAIIPFSPKILAIEPAGELGNMDQFSVFLISQTGVHLLALRKIPVETCTELLIKETAGSLFDVVCTALNVPRNEVYVLAGDKSAEEGKFAKTIIYYKVAGMSYSKIVAKFGSRRMIPAMLCFYDLVDNDRSKFSGNITERNVMADIILQGRIEQYLRHGTKTDPTKDPKNLLVHFLRSNDYYASKVAANSLTYSELLWATKTLGEVRLCYSEIFLGLHTHRENFQPKDMDTEFWSLMACGWKSLYSASPQVFCWFRELLLENVDILDEETLCRLASVLLPWRRELLRKFFCEISDLTEIIDFTEAQDTVKLVNEDYVNLFIHLMLEIIKRKNSIPCKLPYFLYKWEAQKLKEKYLENVFDNSTATTLLSTHYFSTFSASAGHCVCIRNGRLYSWGENRLGRLGVRVDRDKIPGAIEIPIPVNLSSSLKLVIDSVSCGQSHTVALTNAGTLIGFGSNKYGQLGVGRNCSFTESPVSPFLPSVTFICVAAGGYHTVAVDHLNRPWTWGWGVFGQLGNNGIENKYNPCRIPVDERIVMASAGHSHTALLTITGKALTFGCAHFGQIGQGVPNVKVKTPKTVILPMGIAVRSIECGICSTIFVTMKNRIFYTGINPSSVRTMMSGVRRRTAEGRALPPQAPTEPEEKDYMLPVLVDTSHLAGEIVKVSAGTTHFACLTTTGLVYSWGIGKNGQLMRADDECKTLGLIDSEDRVLVASNVICAGECSWIVEKESGRVFGYGFNSSGQIGKMETEQESSILTIKTKKRVLRLRQPANVHYKPKEIIGLPRKSAIGESENSIFPHIEIVPPTDVIGQELLSWVLNTFHKNYSSSYVATICDKYENHEAGATVHTIVKDYESVLRHQLASSDGREEVIIGEYMKKKDKEGNCFQETYRFVDIVVQYWIQKKLTGSILENIIMPYYKELPWNFLISSAVKDMISETNERSKWIAGSFTPSFILNCIKNSKALVSRCDRFGDVKKIINSGCVGKPTQNGGLASTLVMSNGGDDEL